MTVDEHLTEIVKVALEAQRHGYLHQDDWAIVRIHAIAARKIIHPLLTTTCGTNPADEAAS